MTSERELTIDDIRRGDVWTHVARPGGDRVLCITESSDGPLVVVETVGPARRHDHYQQVSIWPVSGFLANWSPPKPAPPDGLADQERWVVVDGEGRLRYTYDCRTDAAGVADAGAHLGIVRLVPDLDTWEPVS